jgi:hypothetical protein
VKTESKTRRIRVRERGDVAVESVNLSKTSERIQRHTRAKPFAEWRCFGSLMTRVSINFKKDGLPGQARQ